MRRSRERDDLAAWLSAAQQRVGELENELARRTLRDPLVGSALTLFAFRAQLDLEIQRSRRYRRPLVVMALDIDGFSRLNNSRGYAAGDVALAAVGELLNRTTRVHDVLCRMGSDEFAVVMPETDGPAAVKTGERVLMELEDFAAGEIHSLSASVGACELTGTQSADGILAAALSAVGTARAQGGGRVALWSGEAAGEAGPHPGGAEVATALAAALEVRDRYTGKHSESVGDLTTRVGKSLGLPAEEIDRVRMAALLHDIGKIGVPDEILHKAGPLDEQEWEIMRQHPAIGERIVRAIPGLGSIARAIRHEHERWDGGGYPDGLVGETIPFAARVILPCDAYHAMVSDRPYRQAMDHADAMAELTGNAGTQFDPGVVQALVGYLYGRRQSGLATI